MQNHSSTGIVTPVLIAGCLIIMASFAIRAAFGVFQLPVREQRFNFQPA